MLCGLFDAHCPEELRELRWGNLWARKLLLQFIMVDLKWSSQTDHSENKIQIWKALKGETNSISTTSNISISTPHCWLAKKTLFLVLWFFFFLIEMHPVWKIPINVWYSLAVLHKRQLLVTNTISWQNSFVCVHNLELTNLEEDFYWSLYPGKHRIRVWTQTDLTAQIWLIFLTCVVASPLGFLYWQRWSSEWPEETRKKTYLKEIPAATLENSALRLIILIKITRKPSKQSCMWWN